MATVTVEKQERPPLGLFHMAVNIVLEMYRSDDKVIEDLQAFVDRFFPEIDLQRLVLELMGYWTKAQDLMNELIDKDVQYVVKHRTDRRTFNQLLGRVNRQTYAVVGREAYREFYANKSLVRMTATALDRGFLFWGGLRVRAYLCFAILFVRAMRKIEESYKGQILSNILGGFVALRASQYENNVYTGDTAKFIEERSALQFLVAYALKPYEGGMDDVAEMIEAAVNITALRFAVGFNQGLKPMEAEARQRWSKLQTKEMVAARNAWINQAVEVGGGVTKKMTFKVELGPKSYLSLLEKGKALYAGKFPTPFLFVPPQPYWRQAITKDEMFPADILQGEIPLRPVPPGNLWLKGLNKQVPIWGAYSPVGGGKTTSLDSTGAWLVDRGYVVFRPTMPRDQGMTVTLPMMPEAADDYKYLTESLRIQPRGLPARFLNIYEKESDIDQGGTFTQFDVRVPVEDLNNFRLNWRALIGGFPRGYLIARQCGSEERTNTMRAGLLKDFFDYRRMDRSRKIAMQTDEMWELLSAIISSPGEAEVIRRMQSSLNNIRGLNIPFYFVTVRPASLQPEILEYLTTFLFSEMRESGADKTKSSRGRLMETIRSRMPDSEQQFLPLIEKMMENVPLKKNFLFFLLDHNGHLHLVRSMLPPHTLENPRVASRKQYELFEQQPESINPGKKKYLRSWNELSEVAGLKSNVSATGRKGGKFY